MHSDRNIETEKSDNQILQKNSCLSLNGPKMGKNGAFQFL